MIQPPHAGPSMRNTAGRTNWSSAFACGKSSAGTRSGTNASNAGPANALPAPYSAAISIMCHSATTPLITSTPNSATAIMRMRSAATSTLRRSNRSLTAPPTSSSSTCGSVCAMPMSASAAGTFESSYACHAMAIIVMPSPRSETVSPAHSSRKSWCRSGVSMRSRRPGRDDGAAAFMSARVHQIEAVAQVREHCAEVLDLLVGVRRSHLDAESDLVLRHERVRGERHVDAAVEQVPANGVDVVVARERHLDHRVAGAVRRADVELGETLEHALGAPVDVEAE